MITTENKSSQELTLQKRLKNITPRLKKEGFLAQGLNIGFLKTDTVKSFNDFLQKEDKKETDILKYMGVKKKEDLTYKFNYIILESTDENFGQYLYDTNVLKNTLCSIMNNRVYYYKYKCDKKSLSMFCDVSSLINSKDNYIKTEFINVCFDKDNSTESTGFITILILPSFKNNNIDNDSLFSLCNMLQILTFDDINTRIKTEMLSKCGTFKYPITKSIIECFNQIYSVKYEIGLTKIKLENLLNKKQEWLQRYQDFKTRLSNSMLALNNYDIIENRYIDIIFENVICKDMAFKKPDLELGTLTYRIDLQELNEPKLINSTNPKGDDENIFHPHHDDTDEMCYGTLTVPILEAVKAFNIEEVRALLYKSATTYTSTDSRAGYNYKLWSTDNENLVKTITGDYIDRYNAIWLLDEEGYVDADGDLYCYVEGYKDINGNDVYEGYYYEPNCKYSSHDNCYYKNEDVFWSEHYESYIFEGDAFYCKVTQDYYVEEDVVWSEVMNDYVYKNIIVCTENKGYVLKDDERVVRKDDGTYWYKTDEDEKE